MSHTVPSLNLYNFEDNQFEDSKYVLTSPRSLEACSRLGVKPTDLLYKPLSEYQEELLPEEIPLRTIFNIYDEQEQARQTKLQLCRKERSRMIEEDRESKPRHRDFSVERRRPSSARPASKQSKCIKVSTTYADDDLNLEKLQRQRTAWATSVGHKRLTHNELEARADALHKESQRLRKVLLARKGRQSRSRDRSNSKVRASSVNNKSRSPRSFSTDRLSRTTNTDRKSRATSIERLSRPTSIERKPRRSVSASRLSVSSADVSIPHRDQKIIDIMTAKREEEFALQRLRHNAMLAWDKERKSESRTRNASENRRRQLLAEERRIYDQRQKSKQEMRENLDEEEKELQKEKLKQRSLKWKSSFLRQQLSKEQKSADKKIYDQLKKRSQKKSLDLQELDNEAYYGTIGRKQKYSLQKAETRRNNSLEHRNKNLMMNNRNERKCHKSNRLDNPLVDVLDKSRQLDDLRHSRAKSNFSKMLDSQYQALSSLHEEREARHTKAREAVSKMDEELEAWRKQVTKERRKSDKYAENVVNRVNELKSVRAYNNRLSKELEHQQNRKKIEAEEEAWRFDKKLNIDHKLRKTHLIQNEKDYAAQQLRATAKLTQQLRDSIRKKYDTDTFDKKVLQAEIHANLGKRTPMKATKNRSSVEIC